MVEGWCATANEGRRTPSSIQSAGHFPTSPSPCLSLSLSLCWIRLVYNLSFSLPFTSSLSSHHPAPLSSTICLPPSSPLSPSITSFAISRFYSAISFLSLPLSLFVVHFPSFWPQTIWALSPPTTLLYIVNQGMATLLINYIDEKFLRILSDLSKLRYIAYS